MRKYYGWFIYGNKEYVIRFKISGSLQWDNKSKCFMDKEWYVRSASEVICYAALDTHPFNNEQFGMALKITHEYFKELRGRGIPRWNPKRPIIIWD